ncbi:uncharacterized protein LOC123453195 [Hordeum vulgare subsp. vulgare]|uniref:uncharacterized protein LOC123453195 n=1 Tax=Hordeum vulgare subsp. vulgare TaxID=112509 RepID=UPI001D1A4E47|nr:uncharacterized protein LOC123453195 [Hordeum vulgare subsp. vulgare]
MRIRRCASRLLGSAAAAPPASCASTEPPRFELPPPAPPAPAHESRPGFVAPEASSSGEPCCELSRSPWDLMNQLDLSDPQAEQLFKETHFISVSWRPSWLFAYSYRACLHSAVSWRAGSRRTWPGSNRQSEETGVNVQ